MIHVCYGLYDKDGHYSKFTGTSMLSIFENTSAPLNSIMVHILHDNTLTQKNRDNFIYIAGKYGQNVKFYNVDEICADKIQFLRNNLEEVFHSRFSIGTFYRLMMTKDFFYPENVSKIIYLDSDTIVNLDIAELWNFPMQNFALASVPEILATHEFMIKDKFLLNSKKVKIEDYFCAGIIILDISKIDEKFFYEGIQWLKENPKCSSFDQDILNNFFAANYCKLPEKFDSFVLALKVLKDNVIQNKIYHYAGQAISFDMQDSYNRLFFNHFAKTPWFNIEIIENLYEFTRKMYNEKQKFILQLAKILQGKERAFLFSDYNEISMRHIFEITQFEEVIIFDGRNSLKNLFDSMKKFQGKKVFFILSDFYNDIKSQLIEAGFAENKDFVNAIKFFSEKHGIPMEMYPFLKAL